MDNLDSLLGLLTWLLTPGAGALAYWLIEEIPQLSKFSPKHKRYAAFVLSGCIAVVAYLGMVAMQYRPTPEDWRQWVEILVSVALAAGSISQIVHGIAKLH